LFNARSLKNKLSEFSFLLQAKKFDILLITETWLSNLVPDSLICPSSDYNVFRTDRNKNGGGVAILTKSFFQVNKLEIKKTPQINIVGIDILLNNNNKIRILNVYLPPKTKSDNVLEFIFILYDLVSIDYPVLITGDLNFVNIDWNSKLNNKLDLSEKYFLEFIENTKLTQLIKFPTRLNNTLDLILSSTPEIVPDIFNGPPFSTSDHNQIYFSLSVPFSFSNSFNKLKTIYAKGNYSAMEFIFSNIDWKVQFSYIQNYNINSIYICFMELVLYIAESHIPKEYISSVNLPPHIQKIQCYKDQLWKNIHYPNVYEKFLSVSAKLRYEQKKFFRNKEKKLLKNKSQKNIFNYISSQIKSKSSSIPTLINNTEILSNNEQKANSFASYFYSTFTEFENHSPNTIELSSSTIEYIDIEEVEVYHLLSQLPLKANTSPDYINNYLLKKCAGSLTLPITQLFRYSLMTGELPDIWKQSLVKPLLKKGDPRNISNYRPISLTCSLCKIIEKIIHSKLLTFFITNNILPESQHGFLKTKSVTTNLLEAHSDWTNALDSKMNVDIVYFDFAKAFDKVSHTLLIQKLEKIGVKGTLLKWIKNFLSNRTFNVKIEDTYSQSYKITSGVIQGSVLGPLLFLFYVHDLPNFCNVHNVNIKFFADDLKAYICYQKSESTIFLQKFIDNVFEWSVRNGLEISLEKCKVLHLGKFNSFTNYSFNNTTIEKVIDSIRDLGIYTNKNLKWTDHILKITRQAYARLYTLLKAIKSNDPEFLIKMYCSYVRPILESSSQIFNPYIKQDISKLENVQKAALKAIFHRSLRHKYTENLNYENLLIMFKLKTLKDRRLILDLICYHKIIYGLIKINKQYYPQILSGITRKKFKINSQIANTNIKHHFFLDKMARLYPKLPHEILTCTKLSTFRQKLLNFDISKIT